MKMIFPNDANGDVLRRMQADGFDFSREYAIDFFAVFASEAVADQVARQYAADHAAGARLTRIETSPHADGGMELILTIRMLPTYENITDFENRLADRVAAVDGYLDGWGVLSE